MGASLWDKLGLPLLIGVASPILVAALCFLSVRLWNCFIKQLTPQTAVEESAYDQTLPNGDAVAVAHANSMPDLELGSGYGRFEGGESMPEPEMELRIVNGGEGMEHFSDQHTRTPVIESPVIAPKAQVTRIPARGALVPVEMDVPHSQQEEATE